MRAQPDRDLPEGAPLRPRRVLEQRVKTIWLPSTRSAAIVERIKNGSEPDSQTEPLRTA
jgi:hypothetical protein